MSAQFIAVPAFDLIVFGGTGDLAMRKILPGLYHRHCDGQLPPESRIIGAARSALDRDAFVARVREALKQFVAAADLDAARVDSYLRRIDYVAVDVTADAGWSALAGRLAETAERVRVFYLATAPNLFGPIVAARRQRPADAAGPPGAGEAAGPRPRLVARDQRRGRRGVRRSIRSTASTTISARRRCRT